MAETKLRVILNYEYEKNYDGLKAGDIYYANFLNDWMICLPIPDPVQYMPFIEFALNTVASSNCPHNNKRDTDAGPSQEIKNWNKETLRN